MAYAESVFPFLYFVDGRVSDNQLDMNVARGFFQNNSMPDGFFRANRSIGIIEISDPVLTVFNAHPTKPGRNQGGINNYVPEPIPFNLAEIPCWLYNQFANQIVPSLYPHPTGALRDALNFNLDIFYSPLKGTGCPQVFPFGQ